MNYYEKFVILDPALSEEDIEALSGKIQDLISKSGGEVFKEDRWGKRTLAFELNKKNQGYYILYTFKAPPSLIKNLEDFYKVYDPVLKFMMIRLGKKQVAKLMDELKKSTEEVAPSSEQGV
jgi:small subunit ribosomal protein S6